MAYGLETWDENGDQTLSVTDRLTRLIYSTVTGLDEESSVTLPDAAGHDAY